MAVPIIGIFAYIVTFTHSIRPTKTADSATRNQYVAKIYQMSPTSQWELAWMICTYSELSVVVRQVDLSTMILHNQVTPLLWAGHHVYLFSHLDYSGTSFWSKDRGAKTHDTCNIPCILAQACLGCCKHQPAYQQARATISTVDTPSAQYSLPLQQIMQF